MIKFLIKKKNILISFVILFLCFFVFVSGVMADDYGLEDTKTAAGLPDTSNDIPTIIGKIIGAGLAFIGILFFILIIYGGFLWMTARGNEEQVKKATELIIQAIIGLIIVATAYLVTKFVGETVLTSLVG